MRMMIVAVLMCLLQVVALGADESTMLELHLDGDVADSSSFAGRVDVKGDVAWVAGHRGKALKLDGKSGLVVPATGALNVGGRSLTMECWFKPDVDQVDHATLVSCGYGHGRMVDLRISRPGKIVFSCAAGNFDRALVASDDVSKVIYDGKWHHVAGVLDRQRNGELRVYLDGREVTTGSGAMPYPIELDDGRFLGTIGAITPWYISKKAYRGLIDEVRMSSVVRPGYEAAANAPMPEPPKPMAIPREAGLSPTDAASTNAVTLSADNVVLMLPRFAGNAEHRGATLIESQLKRLFGTEQKLDKRYDMKPGDLSGKVVLSFGPTVYVRDDERVGIERYGYRIRRKGDVITLIGGSAKGSEYAAVRFLDRFCGIRFYMPGDLFTSMPAEGEVKLSGVIDIADAPYVESCSASGFYSLPEEGRWAQRNALVRRQASHQHNMYHRFPPTKFAERLPEIYPVIDGKRYIPESASDQRWQPTFSEPKLVDAAVESAIEFFQKNPSTAFVGFGVQDSHIHSEIDLATPEVKEHGKVRGLSMLYWRFMNHVAERLTKVYPDKKIVGIVYASVRVAPAFKLHPNVIAWIQYKHSDIEIDRVFDASVGNEGDRMSVLAWAKVASTLGHHDWAHGGGFLIPRIYTRHIQTSFVKLDEMGSPLRHAHGESYASWGLDGPKLYMMAQLWWNPRVDVEERLRLFCDDMFGDASAAMYAYFTDMETLYGLMNSVQERKLYRWWSQFDLNDEQWALARKCRGHLDRAASQARSETAKQRIELFSKTYRLSEMFFELANGDAFDEEAAEQIRVYAREVIEPDPMTIHRQAQKKDFISKHIDHALNGLKGKFKKRK